MVSNVLHLSMEKMLRSEIKSDLNSIPKHQRGSITTLPCIIKRMVVCNQKARDALKNYIKTFDITKFPGKNVLVACLHLKAVAHALVEINLSINSVQRVLEGFAKSSTSSFNKFCTSQIALHCGSFYDKLMSNNSLQTQLNDVLNDLESTYLDLVGAKCGQVLMPHLQGLHSLSALLRMMKSQTRKHWRL